MGQMDFEKLEAELEAERKLAAEVDEAMKNVAGQMTGEIWADIVNILRSERDHIRKLDHMTKETIDQMTRMAEDRYLYVMDLAKDRDETEFWDELKGLYKLLDTVDSNILNTYQIYVAVRIGLHVYYETLLARYHEQADFLKE